MSEPLWSLVAAVVVAPDQTGQHKGSDMLREEARRLLVDLATRYGRAAGQVDVGLIVLPSEVPAPPSSSASSGS